MVNNDNTEKYISTMLEIINEMLETYGESQTIVAKKIQMCQSTVSYLLNGQRKLSLDSIIRFSEYLGIRPHALMLATEEKIDGCDYKKTLINSSSSTSLEKQFENLIRMAYGTCQPELRDIFLTSKMAKIACPITFEAYINKEINSEEIISLMKKAKEMKSDAIGEGIPFYSHLEELYITNFYAKQYLCS